MVSAVVDAADAPVFMTAQGMPNIQPMSTPSSPPLIWQSILFRCPRTGSDVPTQFAVSIDAREANEERTVRIRCASCHGHHHFVMVADRVVKII